MSPPDAGGRGPAVAEAAGGGRGLHVLAVVAAIWTFVLLFVGGLVTSRDAGLSVPDWPLSYGTVNPPDWIETPNVNVEHGHRLLGWVLGILVIALAVRIQREDRRRWMRVLGWSALGLVVLQGVIGGLFRVVLLEDKAAVVHGILGQGFFCVMVALALFTSAGWRAAAPAGPDAGARPLRLLSLAAAVVVYLQVVVGALVRHSRMGFNLEHLWPHVLGAVACLGLGLLCTSEAVLHHRRRPDLVRPAWVLGGGLVLQALLGVGAWMANMKWFEEYARNDQAFVHPVYQVAATTVHQALGAVVLATAVVLHLRVRRLLRDPLPGEAAGTSPAGAVPAGGAA